MYDIIKVAGFFSYDQIFFYQFGMLLIIKDLQPARAF